MPDGLIRTRIPSVRLVVAIAFLTLLAACAGGPPATPRAPTVDQFMASISDLCGKAFAGRIVANEPANPDDAFVGKPLVMHVRDCDPARIAIPFHVGDDHSRTWLITRQGNRLRLEHDHRHADGSADELTFYGGDAADAGSATRQEFPINDATRELFTRLDLKVSLTNVWAMEIDPGMRFSYQLRRPGRIFQVEFDLTQPVPTPPPAWGTTR